MNKLTIPVEWLSRTIRVYLVGCGGTGSEMIDELYRIHTLLVALGGSGLHVTAFDPDIVTAANIGRQRFWPCDIGHPKAEVLVTRINSYADLEWGYINTEYAADSVRPSFDILVTCVDTPKVRAEIGASATDASCAKESFWLDCGNDTSSGNVILGHFSHDSHAEGIKIPNVFDLYPMLADMENTAEPSCSTAAALTKQDYGVNRSVAREAANLLWQLLRHGQISHHGSYIDLKHGTVTPLRIDSKIWSTFYQH